MRHHLQQPLREPSFADLFDLISEVFKREIVAEQLLLHFLGGLEIDVLLDLVDEREDITHAEDARGNAVGMERFEGIALFAHADELKRLTGDGTDGESGAAAGIAVHFGEDDTGDAETFVKFVGGFNGVLAGHGVGDEEDFGGVEGFLEFRQLLHELFINMLAAGGVNENDVAAGLHGFAARGFGKVEGLGFFGGAFVDGRR